MITIEPGVVIYCDYPTNEGGKLPHYGIVVGVIEEITRMPRYRVAYGSSKKVSVSGALPHEFVLWEKKDLQMAGLLRPTRFDMRRIMTLPLNDIKEVSGRLDLTDGQIVRRLRNAMMEA